METISRKGKVYFYEYEFTKNQFQQELEMVGFEIDSIIGSFLEDGIVHNFPLLTGKWNVKERCIKLTMLGRLLKKLLSPELSGHMLCAIVHK